MIKGMAGQPINCQLYDTSGNPFTGACSVYVDGDNTGQVIGATGGGAATHRGNGTFSYIVAAADVNYNHVCFTFVPTGGLNAEVQVDLLTPAEIEALQTATGLSSVVVSDLLLDALIEIRMGRAGSTLEPGLLLWALRKLNRMFDKWNADPLAKYGVGFTSYTPTVNHGPHTIGPSSADWTVTQRPSSIVGANVILNTVSPAVRLPIRIRDAQWWMDQPTQLLGTSIVTDIYYDNGWPNGTVNLWPVPTVAYPIELVTDTLFGSLVMADVLWMPFGYREAATLTLAELCAPGCGQVVSEDLRSAARDARGVVFGDNVESRNIRTRDAGMPGGRRGGSAYNYRTGRSTY